MQGRRARRSCERVSLRSWRILRGVECRQRWGRRTCSKNAPGIPGRIVSRSEKRILRFAQDDVSLFSDTSVRERIRTNLDLVDLGPVLRAALVVEHGARA